MKNITCLAIHSLDNYPGMPKWKFSLAFAYLQAYATKSSLYPKMKFNNLNFYENDDLSIIEEEIIKTDPNIIAISCYVWNFSTALKLIPRIKQKSSTVKVVLGGPEFSDDSAHIVQDNPLIDYIVVGEGEISFTKLLEHIINNKENEVENVDGIICLNENKKEVMITKAREVIQNLDDIPSPFSLNIINNDISDGLVAIETQRGCIQNCAFCNYQKGFKKLRCFSIERVVDDLIVIMAKKPKQLYLMDPTFNSNKKRAKTILSTIIKISNKNGHKPFLNAEMVPDLLDEELIRLAKEAGMTIIEVGIQSLNPKALSIMGRIRKEEKLFENIDIALLYKLRLVPQIIFGLPGDNIKSFFSTFDRVYRLETEDLDILHLLMLPMTRYRKEADDYGILYENESPYRIIESNDFSKEDIDCLVKFTKVVLASLPMKFNICNICEEIGCRPHEIFLNFYKMEEKAIDFKWPIQRERDKNKVLNMLDVFYDFICNQYLHATENEKAEDIKLNLFKLKKKSQFLLIGHYLGVKKTKNK